MHEVVIDTETTGLSPVEGHRVVEIGAIELCNHLPTGRIFHVYLNPERDMPPEAQAVHGLSSAFLADKPTFVQIAEDLLAFIGNAALVIHNAGFDLAFLDAELATAGFPPLSERQVIDTLHLARQKHPGAPNNLDSLCRRYGIDHSKRTRHGALLDAELLAAVYLELIGGRQTTLGLEPIPMPLVKPVVDAGLVPSRPRSLGSRVTEAELARHREFVSNLGENALWRQRS